MQNQGTVQATGTLGLRVIPKGSDGISYVPTSVPDHELSVTDIVRYGMPQKGLSHEVNLWRWRNRRNLWRGARKVVAARVMGIPHLYGRLSLAVFRTNGSMLDLGLASLRVVTNAGVAAIVDAFQNTFELETFRFHALGTDDDPGEFATDTILNAELTTEYNPDGTRATGTLTEAAANIYRTVGTNTVDEPALILEHGIFDQATVGGVLLDRSIFGLVTLGNGDSLQSTYDLTINAGG